MKIQRLYKWVAALMTTGFLLFGNQDAKAQVAGFGSSGLQWLTLTPNVEVNLPLNAKMSLHLPVSYNPWVLSENSRFQQLSFKPGIRYWLRECYSHFFASAYAVVSRYHVGGFFNQKYRYDGRGYGVGVGAGYAYPLNKNFNIEVELGVGAIYADYDKCRWERNSRLVEECKGVRVIPAKIDVSLVFLY